MRRPGPGCGAVTGRVPGPLGVLSSEMLDLEVLFAPDNREQPIELLNIDLGEYGPHDAERAPDRLGACQEHIQASPQ